MILGALKPHGTAEYLSSQLMIEQNAREGDTKTKIDWLSCLHFNFSVFFRIFPESRQELFEIQSLI